MYTEQTSPMGKQREATRPWQILYMDFIGPLPRSKSGNMYLFVDSFSKFMHIFPIKDATSKAIISLLENKIFLIFGVPEVVIADNGKQFISNLFSEFLDKYKVKKWLVAKYHPQANAAEAANKSVGISIRAYIKDATDHRNWDKYIPQIMCAMNTSLHSQSKTTPYFANFGQQMATSGNFYEHHENETIPDIEDFKRIRETVQENLRNSYERAKQRYNLRSRPIIYKEGDVVWKRNFVLSDASKHFAAKLAPKFTKCIVEKRIGTNSYQLKTENGKSIGVFSSKDLKT